MILCNIHKNSMHRRRRLMLVGLSLLVLLANTSAKWLYYGVLFTDDGKQPLFHSFHLRVIGLLLFWYSFQLVGDFWWKRFLYFE